MISPPNYTNTNQGANIEHLFADSIEDHKSAFNKMKTAIGVSRGENPTKVDVVGGKHRKADVIINFGKIQMRCSVKSFTYAGYNHLERRRLDIFCKRNRISNADLTFLKELFLRKGKDPKNTQLVLWDERDRVQRIFSQVEVGVPALVGNDHPNFLVLFSVTKSRFHIYHMQTQVIPLIQGAQISFTTKASNIAQGDFIVILCKGSARGESGGRDNDIQIKMKTKKFFQEISPLCCYQMKTKMFFSREHSFMFWQLSPDST